jgi:hypothetical protein
LSSQQTNRTSSSSVSTAVSSPRPTTSGTMNSVLIWDEAREENDNLLQQQVNEQDIVKIDDDVEEETVLEIDELLRNRIDDLLTYYAPDVQYLQEKRSIQHSHNNHEKNFEIESQNNVSILSMEDDVIDDLLMNDDENDNRNDDYDHITNNTQQHRMNMAEESDVDSMKVSPRFLVLSDNNNHNSTKHSPIRSLSGQQQRQLQLLKNKKDSKLENNNNNNNNNNKQFNEEETNIQPAFTSEDLKLLSDQMQREMKKVEAKEWLKNTKNTSSSNQNTTTNNNGNNNGTNNALNKSNQLSSGDWIELTDVEYRQQQVQKRLLRQLEQCDILDESDQWQNQIIQETFFQQEKEQSKLFQNHQNQQQQEVEEEVEEDEWQRSARLLQEERASLFAMVASAGAMFGTNELNSSLVNKSSNSQKESTFKLPRIPSATDRDDKNYSNKSNINSNYSVKQQGNGSSTKVYC